MKLAVVGSRSFQDYDWLERCLLETFPLENIESIISGGAAGADTLAARFAARHALPLEVILPDWAKYGRKAGPIRNTEIVRRADTVAAFWDGRSRGTQDSINKARMSRKMVLVFPCRPRDPSRA